MVERALVDCRAMTPPAIPDAFRAVLAGLNEQERPRAADTFLNCFGCGPEHPDGLYVRAFPTEEGVLSPIVVARRYEGPPGDAHGGIIAAYMDEILGAAAYRGASKISVTGELTVRYVAPAPLETPLLGRGRMVADHGRYIDVEGTIELLTNGQVVARARGRFFPVANSSRVT
jgi:acyl-coenzyme A thioesterase PaaI-like protein